MARSLNLTKLHRLRDKIGKKLERLHHSDLEVGRAIAILDAVPTIRPSDMDPVFTAIEISVANDQELVDIIDGE